MVKTQGSYVTFPKLQDISSEPRPASSDSKFTIPASLQHSRAHTSNQKRHGTIKKNQVSKILTFEKMIKERFCYRADVPAKHDRMLLFYLQSCGSFPDSKEKLLLPGNRCLPGLCLLGTSNVHRGQGEDPLSAGRTIVISVQNEVKMTSVKAISLSDVVWMNNMK